MEFFTQILQDIYDTNTPFQFPIWLLTSKETKRQAITKDKKNEMKATWEERKSFLKIC